MQSVIRHGVTGGVIMFVLAFIVYLGGPELSSNMWVGFASMAFIIVWMILAARKVKKSNDGIISFGDSFKTMMVAAVLTVLIGFLANALIHGVIDTEYKYEMAEIITEKQLAMMESFGAPANVIDDAIEQSGEMYKSFTIPGMLKSNFFFLIFLAVVALIASAIMKKKPAVA